MKALIFNKYESFDSLKIVDKEIQKPKSTDVTIKIINSSINAMEWHLFRGLKLVRLKIGWFKPKEKFQVLGADISGVITDVGSAVTQFKIGDEVFGDIFVGGYAEYVTTSQDKIIIKPKELNHEQAAACGVAGQTAMEALKHVCNVKQGDKILINGASGGVGTYCLQFAKHLGADITAVSSQKNHELLKQLGANRVIDYNTTDFCNENKTYDWVIEVAGNRKPKEIKKILNPGGTCAVIGFTSGKHIARYMFAFSKKIKMVSFECNQVRLNELAKMLVDAKIETPITNRFSLSEIPKGLKIISSKRSVGKLLVENQKT